MALKPFFFPLLVFFLPRRDWRGMLAAGAGGLGLSLFAMPFVGVEAFSRWISLGATVDWYDHGLNYSLTGVVWRIIHPPPPAFVTWLLAFVVAILALLAIFRSPAGGLRRPDRDFGVLVVAGVLGSPLGWLYYVPLLIPALAALLGARLTLLQGQWHLALAATILLWIPPGLVQDLPAPTWLAPVVREATSWGMLLFILALVRSKPHEHTRTHFPRARHGETPVCDAGKSAISS